MNSTSGINSNIFFTSLSQFTVTLVQLKELIQFALKPKETENERNIKTYFLTTKRMRLSDSFCLLISRAIALTPLFVTFGHLTQIILIKWLLAITHPLKFNVIFCNLVREVAIL